MGKVECVKQDGIATVTFTNPPKGFLTSDMVAQASTIMADLKTTSGPRDRLHRRLIRRFHPPFLGRGNHRDDGGPARAARVARLIRASRAPSRMLWENIDNSRKPTIAAINGYCGGRRLRTHARLRHPPGRGRHLHHRPDGDPGRDPPGAGDHASPPAWSAGKALEWVLRGRTFHPHEAVAEGLVHHCIDGDVLAAAHAMAREFLDKPAAALAAIKQVMRSSWGKSTADGVDEEGDLFANLIASDERALQMMKDYVAGGHQLKKY